MDLRKELIDFLNKVYRDWEDIDKLFPEPDLYVDSYLKSINSGSNETQAVRQNEKTQIVCVLWDENGNCDCEEENVVCVKKGYGKAN